MVIRAKATREVLTMVAYNGKGNIEANQSITFTYTDGTEGAISNYTAAPTPGSAEAGQAAFDFLVDVSGFLLGNG